MWLAATRVSYQMIGDIRRLKPAIRDGLRWMDFALRPHAIVPRYELTRLRPAAPGRH